MTTEEQEIVIKYSIDKSGAMTTKATCDMDAIIIDILTALQFAMDNLSKLSLKAATDRAGLTEKEAENFLRTITIKDLQKKI